MNRAVSQSAAAGPKRPRRGHCDRCADPARCPPCVFSGTVPYEPIDPAAPVLMHPAVWSPTSRIHPLASIGDPPEHRDYIAGRVEALADGVRIGERCVISAFVTIDRGIYEPTRIGDRVMLMAKAHVGHDCQIGNDVEIGASAVLCGHVRVGDNAKIHGLAFIRPGITIGAGARIGGGAVVTKDIPPGELWAGNPAKRLTRGRVAELMRDTHADWEAYAERCAVTREAARGMIG